MSDRPGLFEELQRRNVFRVAAMYAVAAWLLIQIGEATFDALGLPQGSQRSLIVLVVLGFPVVVVLAWIFDVTPEGLVRTSDDSEAEVARLVRGENSFSSLTEVEQRQFGAYQYDRVNLAIHVLTLEADGLSQVHFPYVDRLAQDFHGSPGLQAFLVFVEDDWVGHPELYERLRIRDK